MGEGTEAEADARSARTGSRTRRVALYSAAWVAGAVPLFLVITALWKAFPVFGSTGDITIGAFAIAFPVVVRRLGVPRREGFVRFLLGIGIVFGIVSVLTGWGNGLTDEPFTTPRFVSLLWAHQDPYVVPLVFDYVQYGQTIHSYSIYPYLPLLMFLQIPGIDYKWFALACWVGMVLLVRRRFDAGIFLAQPYVAVMAASGYNDFPVLLLLTVAFVGLWGKRQRWAQLLALGAKQFANVIVLAYYAVRRDWKNVLVTAGVSAAFILPFVVWSGPLALCPSVFANRLAACPGGGAAQYLLNYALWPVWVLAIFYPAMLREFRAAAQKGILARFFARRPLAVDRLLRTPAFAIVGIVGALSGVSVFLGWSIYFGSSLGAALAGAMVGFLPLAVWIGVCDRPNRDSEPLFARSVLPIRSPWVLHGVALLLNIVALTAAIAVGRAPLDGEILGAFLAALWESAAFFPVAPPAGSPPAGLAAPRP
jgi:hypothetical protein